MKMNDETSLTYYSLDNVDWDMALPAIELKVMPTLDIIFFTHLCYRIISASLVLTLGFHVYQPSLIKSGLIMMFTQIPP